MRIEAVVAERSGAVGACLAPVYTLRASLRPWLRCAVVNGVIRVRCSVCSQSTAARLDPLVVKTLDPVFLELLHPVHSKGCCTAACRAN